MARHVDRFIAAMRREGGDAVVFASGEPVRMLLGGQARVLLAQTVRADQIHAIVAEFAAEMPAEGLAIDGESTLRFEALGERVTASLRRDGERLEVVLRSAGHTRSALVSPLPAEAPPTTPLRDPEPTAAVERSPVDAAGSARIDAMLRTLIELEASDLHLTAGLAPRIRRHGDMGIFPGHEQNVLSGDAIRALLFEIAPTEARQRFERSNDADFAHEIPGVSRFRVNLFRDRRGVSGVLRVIPSRIVTADELGLPSAVREFCTLAKGLVLVTGPTGSGKSTTLAAMIDLVNRTRRQHIITIEDPVEFVHTSRECLVNQRELHADTDSFASALRAALREDPDVVLVGELRDLETVAIAIETAETGHLVFATLHTNTATSSVDRMIDQFPAERQGQIRTMLAESLRGVVSQTLCKRARGGRVAALEVLVGSPAVSNLIREGKTFQLLTTMQTQRQLGNQTMNDALAELVQRGLVPADEALSKAIDRAGLRTLLDRLPARGS